MQARDGWAFGAGLPLAKGVRRPWVLWRLCQVSGLCSFFAEAAGDPIPDGQGVVRRFRYDP